MGHPQSFVALATEASRLSRQIKALPATDPLLAGLHARYAQLQLQIRALRSQTNQAWL